MRSKVSSITPLELAELLALIFPISLFFLLDDERVDHKILASFAILVLVAGIFYTRSRLGLIVSVATILNFLFIWALEKWKNHKRGLLGPAILLLYPAGMMTVLGAILFSNRLSLLFLGGAGHEGSNQARIDQWSSGLPIIAENPLFGHGLFQSAAVLGYRTPGGSLTIDSMYLSLALETGVISVILFIVFLSMSSIKGARTYIGGKDAGGLARTGNALASILFSVLIIKLVLSQRNNHTLIFLVLGIMTNMPNLAKKGKDKLLNYRFSANQIVEKRSAGQ